MKYLVLLAAIFSCTAWAQATKGIGATMEGQPGARPVASSDQRINKLDSNKDGKISRDEASGHARLSKGFDRIDTNKDGLLSRDELKAFKDKRKANREVK